MGAYVTRGRLAQLTFAGADQALVDDVVTGVAWAGYRKENAELLARHAVTDSGMGRFEDKVDKIQRKTMGTLSDLQGAISVGVISQDPITGITEIAKPVGVVAALIPSTNPAATPINKAMMILKGRNAVIFAPSPRGAGTCALAVDLMHAELEKVGVSKDLVQYLPRPSRELSNALMQQCDFVVVTGSQRNVRSAYQSGTPAIGVGVGNAVVVVEASADLSDAAAKIKRSKTFDYATSCSSENSLVIEDRVYDAMMGELAAVGGYLLSAEQARRLREVMWVDGRLSPSIIAQSPGTIADLAAFEDPAAHRAEFFMVEEDGVGPDHPFSGEKLSVVLTLYRYHGAEDAVRQVREILAYQGLGHSCGIHTREESLARRLADEVEVARVLVNQAHAFGNGGAFNNGLNFTLTMGAGTWAGNSISENLSYRHFLNTTRLAWPIPGQAPAEAALWGDYWERYGS